jgi:hypothetical protein
LKIRFRRLARFLSAANDCSNRRIADQNGILVRDLSMTSLLPDLPLLQSLVDFYAFPGVPLRYTPGYHPGAPSALKSKCLKPSSKTG